LCRRRQGGQRMGRRENLVLSSSGLRRRDRHWRRRRKEQQGLTRAWRLVDRFSNANLQFVWTKASSSSLTPCPTSISIQPPGSNYTTIPETTLTQAAHTFHLTHTHDTCTTTLANNPYPHHHQQDPPDPIKRKQASPLPLPPTTSNNSSKTNIMSRDRRGWAGQEVPPTQQRKQGRRRSRTLSKPYGDCTRAEGKCGLRQAWK